MIGENGKLLKPGDVCKILNGFSSIFKGALTFYVGKSGVLKKTGEFCFMISEEPNLSYPKPQIKTSNEESHAPSSHKHHSGEFLKNNILQVSIQNTYLKFQH